MADGCRSCGVGVLGFAVSTLGQAHWCGRSCGLSPLAAPKPVAEAIWLVDDSIVASGLLLPIRMTVMRLASGDLVLRSPCRFTPNLGESLGALGTVLHLVAPITAHWIHLAEWQRAYPNAKTWAVPGLRDRGQVRRAGVRIDEDLQKSAPEKWAGELDQGLIAGGLGFVEAYFFHRVCRTLVLCDLVQNLEQVRLPPVTRWAVKAARGTAGTTANHVRAVLWLGSKATRRTLRTMVAIEPEQVIFAHGEIFASDVAPLFRTAFAWGDGRQYRRSDIRP
jgi:hypothetical protein